MNAERNQVDRLLRQGVEDKDIMRQLGMSANTFYHHKRRIYDEEARIFKQQTVEDVAYKSNSLHCRLVKLYNLAERKIETAADIAKGENNPTKDFAATLKVAEELAINIFQLETQGIQVARSEFNRSIHRLEDQESKLLPISKSESEPEQ